RLINFFLINKQWTLVDLPGYGYAKVSISDRERFNEFVSNYLVQRENLRCVFVLIDARHTPQKIDLQFTEWLVDYEVPFVLVFTKTDKVKPGVAKKNREMFLESMKEFSNGQPRVFVTSAETADGRKDLLEFIGKC
ncbi:MAG: ribosome biogenesis GTP-binding protein YihA/YsxC, partial [Akkermansiaceae bacterium]